MNFNKTTEYLLRIMSFMAMDEGKLYNADMLSQNLGIPFRYLRKQLTKLVKSELLVSYQGKNGGYKLIRPPEEITLWDIVQATEEMQIPNNCIFGFEYCAFGNYCSLHIKWGKVQDTINEMLKSTTLAYMKQGKSQRFQIQQNYTLTKTV